LFDAAGLPQLRSVLLGQIGSLYQDQRDYDAAGSAYAEALDATTVGGDEHQRARVLHNIGTLALGRGPGDAEAPPQEAAEVFGRRGDTYNAAAAKLALGYVRESLGRPAEASGCSCTLSGRNAPACARPGSYPPLVPSQDPVGLEYTTVAVTCFFSQHVRPSGSDMVLVRESAEDLLAADPVLGKVDWLGWPGVSLSWRELAKRAVRPAVL
jgi:hypothetical protein